MTDSTDETLGGDDSGEYGSPLQNISEDGVIPKHRFKNAGDANSWFTDKLQADYWPAFNRYIVDEVIDGAPPASQEDLIANGMGNNFNINFGRAFAKEEQSLSAFNELGDSEEQLIRCEIEMDNATPAQKEEWAQIFAEGYTRLMRYDWPDFQPNMLMLAKGFIRHGVSIAFRQSEFDWRWSVSRLGDMQTDRRQGCSVNDFECVGQRVFLSPAEAEAMIQDEEAAEKVGWNVAATKRAIHEAKIEIVQTGASTNWDQLSRDVKDNGLYMTRGKDPRVEFRHYWVKEFDGKVTHIITSPNNNEEYLYCKESRWDSTANCMVLFTYGIGNGDIYSIRGLGYKIANLETMFNVIMSRLGDRTLRDLSLMWQPASADSLVDSLQIVWGGDTLVPQGVAPVKIEQNSNMATALQMLNMLSNVESINTGTYTASQQLLPGGRPDRKTATEAQIEAQQEAVLTTSAKVLFFQSLDRLDQMTVKALTARDYPRNMPGGELRWKFLRYCLDRGMPEEAFYKVTCVRHVRPIGLGSMAEQQAKLGVMFQNIDRFDGPTQRIIMRKLISSTWGVEWANTIPLEPIVPRDKKDAELEASLFINGITPEILPTEDFDVHLSEHVPFAANTLMALEQGEIDQKEAIKRLTTALPHMQQELQLLQQNPAKARQVQQYQQAIAKIASETQRLVQNYSQEEQARQEAIAKEQEEMNAEKLRQQREDFKAQAQVERERYKAEAGVEIDQFEAEQRARNSAAKAEADISAKTALTDSTIDANTALTTQKLAVKDITTAQDIRNAPQKETSKEKPSS